MQLIKSPVSPHSFNPQQVQGNVLALLQNITKAGDLCKVPYASDTLNSILRPQLTLLGETEYWIAASGAGKSQILNWRARQEGHRLNAIEDNDITLEPSQRLLKPDQKLCVVAIGLEESIEAKGLSDCGFSLHTILDKSFMTDKSLKSTLDKRMRANTLLPIFRIGTSSIRKNGLIDLKAIWESIKILHEEGWQPTMICLDHINDIHHDNADDMRKATEDAAIQCSQMAQHYNSVMVIAAQAKMEVDNRNFPAIIPQLYDSMWSSKIAQLAWRVIGLYRPFVHLHKYEEEQVTVDNIIYQITPHLIFLRVSKARENDPFPPIIPCYFYPKEDRLEVHQMYLDVVAKMKASQNAQNGAR